MSSFTHSIALPNCDKCFFDYPLKNYLYVKEGAYYKIEGHLMDVVPKKRFNLINYRDPNIKHFNKIYYIEDLNSFFEQNLSDSVAYINMIVNDLRNQEHETVYANILTDERGNNSNIMEQLLKLKIVISDHNNKNDNTYFEEEESEDSFPKPNNKN